MPNPEKNSFDFRSLLIVVALAAGGAILNNSIERLDETVERLETELETQRNFNNNNFGGLAVVDPSCLKIAPPETKAFSPEDFSPESTETTTTSTSLPNPTIQSTNPPVQSTTTTTPKIVC